MALAARRELKGVGRVPPELIDSARTRARRLSQWRLIPACVREAELSDAFRQQTDPLEPAGRRFANFFLEEFFFEIFPFSIVGSADRPRWRPAWAALWLLAAVAISWVGGWCGRRGAGFDGVVGGAGRSAARYGGLRRQSPLATALTLVGRRSSPASGPSSRSSSTTC